MKKTIHVAAAVICGEDGRILLGQRGPDSFYPGYWEFPGGKLEQAETPAQALIRELHEELAIEIRHYRPWIVRRHNYEHADVRLHFFVVTGWSGAVQARVHADLLWATAAEAQILAPMLPANAPILKMLQLPSLMAVTDTARYGREKQLHCIAAALQRGICLIQIREKTMASADMQTFAAEVSALCRPYQAIVVLNGPVAQARCYGMAGVHLTAVKLHEQTTRPDCRWVGASCHSEADLLQAAELGLDYVVLGSVLETATHPGQSGMGWQVFAGLAQRSALPVFAIGGMNPALLAEAQRRGAHGVAGVRCFWEVAETVSSPGV